MTDTVTHPIAKAVTPITIYVASMNLTDWAQFASFVLASLCSITFLIDWFYKRFYKPWAIKTGRMKGTPRPYLESTDNAPFMSNSGETDVGALDRLPRS